MYTTYGWSIVRIMCMLIMPVACCAADDVRKRMKWRSETNIVINRFDKQNRPKNQILNMQVRHNSLSHITALIKILGV